MSNTPNPIDTLKEARDFVQGNSDTEFLLVRKQGNSPEVGKLNIGFQVEQELDKNVTDELTEHIDNLREGKALSRPLDVANTVSDESLIQYVHVDDLPDGDLFDVLNTRTNHPTTTYTDDPTPNFQLIRASEPGGKLFIGVQNYTSASMVDTTNELALLYKDKEYERFMGDLLVIKQSLNAIYYDGWVYIISPKSFEGLFEMREEYEKRAQEAIQAFENVGVTFTDKETTTGWLLSHINMLRDMYEIHENDIPNKLTPDKIEAMIKKYQLCQRFSLQYTRRNGQIELSIDDYQHTWKLLKLLGAKYAEDDILGTQWEISRGLRL